MIKRAYIEITNVCNLSCSFCKKNTRAPRFMSPAEFETVLGKISAVTKYIYLHVQGEPLLHKDFNEIMRIAHEYDCKVQLVTNGILLKDHMDLLSMPALRKISFSLQSIEYHTMAIDTFMDPVIHFIEEASANGHPYCELRFWRDDQMELARTKQCLDMLRQRYSFAPSEREKNDRILPGVYVDYANPFAWPDLSGESQSDTGTCLGGLEQIAVLSDGTAVPCCLDAEGRIALGSLFEESMEEILNKERYKNLVNGFSRHRMTEDLCRKCTFRNRFG